MKVMVNSIKYFDSRKKRKSACATFSTQREDMVPKRIEKPSNNQFLTCSRISRTRTYLSKRFIYVL